VKTFAVKNESSSVEVKNEEDSDDLF
jgi:hypothetical protein